MPYLDQPLENPLFDRFVDGFTPEFFVKHENILMNNDAVNGLFIALVDGDSCRPENAAILVEDAIKALLQPNNIEGEK